MGTWFSEQHWWLNQQDILALSFLSSDWAVSACSKGFLCCSLRIFAFHLHTRCLAVLVLATCLMLYLTNLIVQLTKRNFGKFHIWEINVHMYACSVHYIPQLVTLILRHPNWVFFFLKKYVAPRYFSSVNLSVCVKFSNNLVTVFTLSGGDGVSVLCFLFWGPTQCSAEI